ncbi:type II toxin-antitoxin system RelE/ParE family toxin [Candidatus Woesearchaeota archaeon]|nr:type II toxin-antitoxin system RelE/ParE family toxin [Candidatus Woesearchaeota archaeon]
MYEIIFDEKAIEELNKLPHEKKKRIFEKIISTKKKPFHFFKKLKGRKDYRLRVGDYRVIADINKDKQMIEVTLIRHRKNVYRDL